MAKSVIASLPEARAALEAARSSGVAAELESPPDAASIYGVLWFAELHRALQAEFPDQPFTLTLDCGERADLAHSALVEGIKRIRFSGHREAAKALRDIAQQVGAEFVAAPRPQDRIYVIAELDLSAADRDCIQSVRKLHDPQFDLVGPHFTLVFGMEGSLCPDLLKRTREMSVRTRAFAFDLQSARVFSKTPSDHYVFLIPDLGSQELVALHEALNPSTADRSVFMPHLTVGRTGNMTEADALAAKLNAKKRIVRGRVAALKVVAVADSNARDIAAFQLAG